MSENEFKNSQEPQFNPNTAITPEPPADQEPIINQEPVETQEPFRTSEPMESQEPIGVSEPMESQEPIGVSEPMGSREPIGVSEPIESQEASVSPEPNLDQPIQNTTAEDANGYENADVSNVNNLNPYNRPNPDTDGDPGQNAYVNPAPNAFGGSNGNEHVNPFLQPLEPKKKEMNKVLIPILIIAALAVIVVIAVIAAMLFASPKKKVLNGMAKTMESVNSPIADYIKLDQKTFAMGSYEQNLSLNIDDVKDTDYGEYEFLLGGGVDMQMLMDAPNEKLSYDLSVLYGGSKLVGLEVFGYDNTLALAIPKFFEGYFEMPLTDIENTYEGSFLKDYMIEIFGTEDVNLFSNSTVDINTFQKEYADDVKALYKAITVKKTDSMNIRIGSKEQSCTGYDVVIPKAELITCIKDFINFTKDYSYSVSSSEQLDFLYDSTENFLTQDLNFIVYLDKKGRAVKITHEGTYDGSALSMDLIWHGKEYLFDDFEGTFEITDSYGELNTIAITNFSKTDNDTIDNDLYIDVKSEDIYSDDIQFGLCTSFDTTSGYLDASFELGDGYTNIVLTLWGAFSNIKAGKDFTFSIDEFAMEMDDFKISLSGEYSMKPLEGGVSSPSGTAYDLSKMTESEVEDLIYEIGDNFYETMGSLFGY